MNKLPQELRLILSRQVNEDTWNLDELMEVMEKEITARERAAGSSQVQTQGIYLLQPHLYPVTLWCPSAHTVDKYIHQVLVDQ